MDAEIIAVGSELTNGSKLDTNSQWLSIQLAELGIETHFHSCVGDDCSLLVEAFRAAAARSDVVLITGGLGPTLDDLTRDALAQFAGTELELHQPSLDFIERLFSRRGRRMPERNRVQAMFPIGSEVLRNPRGTAPGIWMEQPKTSERRVCFAALPGVPSEMKRMFEREVKPRLAATSGGRVILRARVNCFGLGESAIEERLRDLTARGHDPEVGITAHEATITLRILATGTTREECEQKICDTKITIHERLGSLVFGEEDEEIEHAVLNTLRIAGRTLCAAELGSGGLLAHRATQVGDAADAFLGALVLRDGGRFANKSLAEIGEPVRAEFGADFALVTGPLPTYAPDSADEALSAPETEVALVGEGVSEVRDHNLLGDPAIQQSRLVKAALNLLRLHLMREAT